MKKIFPFLFVVAAAFTSCSKDDADGNHSAAFHFLPQQTGNYWTYDVTGSAEGSSGRDSVYVANDTTIGGIAYKKMKSRTPVIGFYANSVNNNSVRVDGTKLLLTGTSNFDLGEEFPIDIALQDFIVFDSSKSSGSLMDTFSGTTHQTLDGTPVTIDYTLTSTAGASLDTYLAPDQVSYTDVKSATIKINIKVSIDYQGFPIVILPSQDVVTSVQYYANNIGVVNSDTTIHYQLDETFAALANLPFPTTATETQTETLDTYMAQ